MATKVSIRDNTSLTDQPVQASNWFRRVLLPSWVATADSRTTRRFGMAVVMFIAIGAAVRLVGLFDDFWLDEIWSWTIASRVKSIREIFFGIHHDNNHYLNTLWIYLCGEQSHWYVYRLHSYVAGLVTIVACGYLAGDLAICACQTGSSALLRQKTKREICEPLMDASDRDRFARRAALITMFLVATCHMACVYSTEARGYALAGAAAIFSTLLLRRMVDQPASGMMSVLSGFMYAGVTTIGFLSQLTFITIFAPQLVWATIWLSYQRRFLPIFVCFLPPVSVLGLLWYFDLRIAKVGGSQLTPLLDVALESLAIPMGLISPTWLLILCAVCALIMLLVPLYFLSKRNIMEASLFGFMLFFAPPLMLVLRPEGLLSPRHFLVLWITLLPLCGLGLAQIGWQSGRSKWILTVIILVWTSTNGWEFTQFARYGRGGYRRAIDWLVTELQRDPDVAKKKIWIGSDHDFRNQWVLFFYRNRIPEDLPLVYLTQDRWPPEGVDWLIAHNLDRDYVPEKELHLGRWTYQLAHVERFSAPIGFHWALYRRRDPTTGAR